MLVVVVCICILYILVGLRVFGVFDVVFYTLCYCCLAITWLLFVAYYFVHLVWFVRFDFSVG